METKELIAKIEALKVYAAEMRAKHDTRMTLLRPTWLENLPVAQFVELCDKYDHDPVNKSMYPSTWLRFGDTQLTMSCEKVAAQPVPPVDHLDSLRELIQTSAAA